MDRISVIGLGYVGLPIAAAFAEKCSVIAFDKNQKRIEELHAGFDRNKEISQEKLNKPGLCFTDDPAKLAESSFHIIAVPTPIDKANRPDLTLLKQATETIANALKRGDIVVYESTVYPGVTEEICLPILESISKLKCPDDFTIGYSPERINPGDELHQLHNIIKVVSACDQKTCDKMAAVYGEIAKAGIYKAKSIKVAEAAKVIENTQRDLNIALMNELAIIFDQLEIDTSDVLAAANTKWNFLPFKPGLVGGHCIGVDPYYLTHKAEEVDYHPQVILAGRRINDNIARYIVEKTVRLIHQSKLDHYPPRIGVLGITFKENCVDIRNSKVFPIVRDLKLYAFDPLVHDPMADPEETFKVYGIELASLEAFQDLDVLILAVPHSQYDSIDQEKLRSMLSKNGIVIDIKSFFDRAMLDSLGVTYWRL